MLSTLTPPQSRFTRRALLLAALAATSRPLGAEPAANAVQARPLQFPADFGSHPQTRIEWWYVTGSLEAGSRLHGFQITFFRSRTDVPASHPSRFAASQIIFAHAAVTDLQQSRLRHDQRIARAGFDIAQASQDDTGVGLRDWRLQRHGPVGHSRYDAAVKSDAASFSYALTLSATQPVLLQGDAGYSRKGPRPEQASLYYSEPQLDVGGTLTLDGLATPVRGKAWLDHEWSDAPLDPQAVGWDWIGMNLDDGRALTAFRLRRADGSALWAGGSIRGPNEASRSFAPDDVRFTPGRSWTSPASRASYPVDWMLDTPAGRFRIKPLLDNQELDSRASSGAIYWEGLSDLLDEQGRRLGRGYLEMTGYVSALKL